MIHFKKSRGITLVTLIITIVIMLILAAVSIGAINGELFEYAGKAKKGTDITGEKETIAEAFILAKGLSKTGRVTEVELKRQTDKYDNITNVTTAGELFTIEFTSGREYLLDQNGNITEKEGLLAYEIPSTVYGSYVFNYSDIDVADGGASQLADWQIFYAGKVSDEAEDHIYLIASNCVAVDSLPKSKKGYSVNKDSSDYSAYFATILSDYSNGSDDVAEETRYLNKEYYKYLEINGNVSKNNNMKVVAYLCDTSKWNIFKTDKADFVIGGPSLELFVKSYNKKYNANLKHGYTTVDEEGNTIVAKDSNNSGTIWGNGYRVSTDGSTWSAGVANLQNDSTYFLSNSVWLASPSASTARDLPKVIYEANKGLIRCDYCNWADHGAGFRPVVRLNKNVQLKKVEGGYRIVE